MTTLKITKQIAGKILTTIDAGLCKGLGAPNPGGMCIMAAFNYALGRPHSDKGLDDCVGTAVRAFDIALNDCDWSSNEARAKGMRRESIAKLGSNQIDQKEFSNRLAIKTTQIIVAAALRSAAEANPSKKDSLKAAAVACEAVKTVEEARSAAYAAAYAANAANAAAYAANAAAYAAHAAAHAAHAAANAANAAHAANAAYAAYAAAYAAHAAYAAAKDKMLCQMADIGLSVLIEMKSPGCKFLYLCDGKKPSKARK